MSELYRDFIDRKLTGIENCLTGNIDYNSDIMKFYGGSNSIKNYVTTLDYTGANYNAVNIINTSKNIKPVMGYNGTRLGVTCTYDSANDVYELNGTTTGEGNIVLAYLPTNSIYWKIPAKYTLSVTQLSGAFAITGGSSKTFAVGIFNTSGSSYIRGGTNGGASALNGYTGSNLAFSSTGDYRIYFQTWRIGTVFSHLKIRIQIELGTTSTTYERYRTPNIYNCPISQNDIYGGYMDPINGILTSTLDSNGDLLPEPISYDIAPEIINVFNGYNAIYSDSGISDLTVKQTLFDIMYGGN